MTPPEPGRAESIGQRLRRLRLERGLSQRDLSAPGVSYAYISRIESGARQPSVKALRKLALKLEVSTDYLETGDEIPAADRRELELADAELELRLAEQPEQAERRLRELLADAVRTGDVRSAVRARVALGTAAVETGRPREAAELLEEALASGAVRPSLQPEVFAQLGHAYGALGQVRRAIELYEGGLAEVEELEPENVAARVQLATHLSYALSDAGELERAQEVLDRVLGAAPPLLDRIAQIGLYWSLARLTTLRGEPNAALANARRAIALLEATENTVQLGRARLLSGVILLAQGRPDEAGAQFEQAETLLGPRPNPADLASLRTEQARRAVALGQGAEAAGLAHEALELLGDTDPGERGRASQALAAALALQDEREGALEAFRRAADCFELARRFSDAALACREWARTLREAGRESEALDVLERAADLAGRRETVPLPLEA